MTKYYFKIKRWTLGVHLFLLAFVFVNQSVKAQMGMPILPTGSEIIQKSIEAHGGAINKATLSFTFRDKLYKGIFDGGDYEMSRQFQKGDSLYLDKLNNTEFVRTINNKPVELSERWRNGYSNSVNSVFYFAMLPFKLNDKAVIITNLGTQKTKNGEYYLLKVSFKQEGGGTDHQDQFRYWINTKTYTLDYFAYSYETSGGGVRFRSVVKRHKLDSGYVFQDYINYKANVGVDLDKLLQMHENGELNELSKIELLNVSLKKGE